MPRNSNCNDPSPLFRPGQTVSVIATATSQSAALGEAGSNVLVSGSGGSTVFIKFGTSSAVSVTPADGIPVFPGSQVIYRIIDETHFAVCTESGDPVSRISVTSGAGEE